MTTARVTQRASMLVMGALAALCLLGPAVAGSAGSLDDSFGGDGKVTTSVGSGSDSSGYASVLQANDKLVVGGYAATAGMKDFALVRYKPNGKLDGAFGDDGKVTTDFEGADEEIYGLDLQEDGKIVAVGFATVGGENMFALARYNPDGSLDDTFGVGGKVTTDFGADSIALDVHVLGDGKILVVGGATPAADEEMAIARYLSDGTPDPEFGGDGTVTTAFPEGPGRGFALDVKGGSYVVAGWVTDASTFRIVSVARFDASGMLDATFGGDGRVTLPFPGGDAQAGAVDVRSSGEILVAGTGFNQATDARDFTVARFTSEGQLDATFGGDGIAQADLGGTVDGALGLVVQSDGKIVLGGSGGKKYRFALVRFKKSGARDKKFGSKGKVKTKFPGSSEIWGLSLRSDKIWAAGYADSDSSGALDYGFAAARYKT